MINLRALTTSELMDLGFTLYRKHFAGFFLIALLSQSAVLVAQVAVMAFHLNPTTPEVQARPLESLERLGFVFIIYFFAGLISFAGTMVTTTYLAEAYLGHMPSIKESLKKLVKSWLGGLWTCVLSQALIFISLIFPLLAFMGSLFFFALIRPQTSTGVLFYGFLSLVLVVLSLAPMLIILMRLMAVVPALCLEGKAGWAGVRRSFSLVMYDPGLGFFYWGEMRLSFLLLPLFVIELIILSLTTLPFVIYRLSEAIQHGDVTSFNQEPDATFIISQILTFLAGSLILPLYPILTALFYYDVRIRREGYDLEVLSARLRD